MKRVYHWICAAIKYSRASRYGYLGCSAHICGERETSQRRAYKHCMVICHDIALFRINNTWNIISKNNLALVCRRPRHGLRFCYSKIIEIYCTISWIYIGIMWHRNINMEHMLSVGYWLLNTYPSLICTPLSNMSAEDFLWISKRESAKK